MHVKKKIWYQEAHQFFQELPPPIQRGFANADELAKMVRTVTWFIVCIHVAKMSVGQGAIATARWRRVMFARLNAGENRSDLVAKLANAEYRQRVAFALAAIVLPPPHFLPTVQEIQRADLNLEQWLLE